MVYSLLPEARKKHTPVTAGQRSSPAARKPVAPALRHQADREDRAEHLLVPRRSAWYLARSGPRRPLAHLQRPRCSCSTSRCPISDAKLRTEMRVELKRLHQSLAATIIYVTHDQIEAMTLVTRIAVMRAGRIEQYATPDMLYERPETLFVAGVVGSPGMNFLSGSIGPGTVPVARIETDAIPLDGYPLHLVRRQTSSAGLAPEPVCVGLQLTRRWRGMDSNLYGAFPCQVVVFSLLPVLCSERERAVLHPVAYDQVPGARGMGSRDRNASKAWRPAA